MNIYNKPLFYIGAILTFGGTYLDYSNNASNIVIYICLILGLLLMLLAFRKPKNESDSNNS
jgi:hypothetical protein